MSGFTRSLKTGALWLAGGEPTWNVRGGTVLVTGHPCRVSHNIRGGQPPLSQNGAYLAHISILRPSELFRGCLFASEHRLTKSELWAECHPWHVPPGLLDSLVIGELAGGGCWSRGRSCSLCAPMSCLPPAQQSVEVLPVLVRAD